MKINLEKYDPLRIIFKQLQKNIFKSMKKERKMKVKKEKKIFFYSTYNALLFEFNKRNKLI